jgi:YbbR domain-containing protein
MEIRATLNLPEGVTVVGSQNITVQIGIAPVESSINFNNIPVQFEGLGAGLSATTSPDTVDVYLSGPLYLLEALDPATLVVAIDLTDRGIGTYQLAPEVLLEDIELNVDAILPNTLEVTITAE